MGRCAARCVRNDRCQHGCGPSQFVKNVMSEPSGHITMCNVLLISWKDKRGQFHFEWVSLKFRGQTVVQLP